MFVAVAEKPATEVAHVAGASTGSRPNVGDDLHSAWEGAMTFIKLQLPPSNAAGVATPAASAVTQSAPVPSGTTAFAANDVAVAATNNPGIQPDALYWWVALILIVIGIILGAVFSRWPWFGDVPAPSNPPQGISPFAGLFVAAQALERLGEFISLIPGLGDSIGATNIGNEPKTKSQALAARNKAARDTLQQLKSGNMQAAAQQAAAAADNQHATDVIRANRSVFFWGFNSFLASLLVGVMKLDVMAQIGVLGGGALLHVAVTGLAIGGGTKPLHDLIANLQQSKQSKQDQPAAGGG